MKAFLLGCFVLLVTNMHAQKMDAAMSLIPQPVSMQQGNGQFLIKPTTQIEVNSKDADVVRVAEFLSKKISNATGYTIATSLKAMNGFGQIRLLLSTDTSLHKEGYKLIVTKNSVSIFANQPAGLFYGMQTLLQLLPKQIGSKTSVSNVSWTIPEVNITDYPRFGWRGLMFDVTRHYFTKDEVKRFIDDMVQYKYNMLHLHLTDDQGWRIQIKSLPKLTDVGAWRVKREGKWGNQKGPEPGEPATYGGFYTHEDIKELVQYAKERFVNILPEVDVPGHSMAAVASYPELSCTPGEYHVNSGEKFINWGNPLIGIVDNTLCPANENVYQFLDKVFTEVAQLFPFEYIHMGGDECPKNFWEKSDAVKALQKKENLKNMSEVQSYFVKRVEKIVNSKGKKLMGWDEILEGGLAPDASVMSWRGMKGGIEAAKMNHHVVMAPSEFVYVDLMQGDPITEPTVYSTVKFSKTYQFDPVPAGVDPKYILGGQGNLWTEQITNLRAAQYMLWPRGLAIAESVWSPKERKDWPNFVERVENQFERMDEQKIKYATTMYEPMYTVTGVKDTLTVKLDIEAPGVTIYYSFDETNPDEFYPKYEAPLLVPRDALNLKVVSYKDGKPVGRLIKFPVEELLKRTPKKK